jgi:hypothetical protein
MNTPTHLIIGAAAFAKPGAPWITVAALTGALFPDLSLYLLAGWHLFVLDVAPRVVFGQLYYSESWQSVFAVDNSFIVWGVLLAIAAALRKPVLIAFTGAAFLHLLFDFPLHNHDARQHFWPVSDWVFISPVSYWDSAHYGNFAGPVEMILSLGLLAILWRRFQDFWIKIALGCVALIQLAPSLIWMIVF